MLISAMTMHATGIIPRFYGVAYYKTGVDCVVMYPIPINKIVGTVRRWWIWAKRAPSIAERDADLLTAYTKGRTEGYKAGEQDCLDRLDKWAKEREIGDQTL